jgi:hypothetical protein
MDLEFVKWLSGLGVGGVLAAFIFNAYRKDMANFTQQWKGQTELLIAVVRENTVAFTRNTEVVQSLHTHMVEGERRNLPRRLPGSEE